MLASVRERLSLSRGNAVRGVSVVAFFIASVACPYFARAANLGSEDTSVLAAVLSNFGKSRESAQFNRKGYLAVAPQTMPVDASLTYSDYFESFSPRLTPPAPPAAMSNFLDRNRLSHSANKLGRLGGSIRIVTRELARRDPTLSSNPEYRPIVFLRVPGYSDDSNWAYVDFQSLWSIHGADAVYLLKRIDGKWTVVATAFDCRV
jgi:hypothetical protein